MEDWKFHKIFSIITIVTFGWIMCVVVPLKMMKNLAFWYNGEPSYIRNLTEAVLVVIGLIISIAFWVVVSVFSIKVIKLL